MNKAELTKEVAKHTRDPQCKVERIINEMIDTIQFKLSKGNDVTLQNFGSFLRVERPERTCRNPMTGNLIVTPVHYSPKFRAGKQFKELVNK
jgi:DNA-binding protein HU-beta